METAKPEIVKTGDGLNIYYKGKYLYSSISPEKNALQRVEGLHIPPDSLVIIPSIGLGYGLDKLINKLPDNNSHILCIDTDEELFKLAVTSGIMPTNTNKLTAIRTDNENTLKNIIESIGIHRFRRVISLSLNRGYSLYRGQFDALISTARKLINAYWQNKITTIKLGTLWLKNLIDNLELLKQAYDYKSIKINLPVVVIGAGPSLENSLPFISKNHKYTTLVVVDTAIPILATFSIHPDIVITQDAQIFNLQDFIPSPLTPKSLIVADIVVSPTIFRNTPDIKKVLFKSDFARLKLFERMQHHGLLPSEIPPLGSVGITALYLAIKSSESDIPILTTGLDFGYSKGASHARESTFYKILNMESSKLMPGEHINFKQLTSRPIIKPEKVESWFITDFVLYNYKKQFNSLLTERDNIFILNNSYPWHDETEKRVISQETAERLIQKHYNLQKAAKNREKIQIQEKKSPYRAENLKIFINQELKLLTETMNKIISYLNAKESISSLELKKALSLIDYTFFSFPDYNNSINTERHFLRRVLISCSYFKQRFANLL